MKQILKKTLFIAILSLCASFPAFAQRDNSNTPPKEKPPRVVVPSNKDDKPKDDKKDDDKKPRRPQSYGFDTLQFVNIMD